MNKKTGAFSFKDKSILVIAPHPDDEIFGCGGLIHRCKAEGGKVYVLYLTVGTTKDLSKKGSSTKNERIKELKKVVKFLGIDGYKISFPGNEYHLQLDSVPQKTLIDEIERGNDISIEELKPTLVLVPSPSDYNQDHRAAYTATITASRPAPKENKWFVPTILTYEFPYGTWSPQNSIENPNMYIALQKENLAAKLGALKLYRSQLKSKRGPLSLYGVESLAKLRGIECDEKAAEAFFIDRFLV